MRSLGDPRELEEERRLAYVGITRARERLYVSRATVRSAWGAPQHNPASRFLDELPDELVDWRRTEADQTQWGGGPAQPTRAPRRSGRRRRRAGGATPRGRSRRSTRATGSSHDSFGLGTVVAIDGVGERSVASVDFGSQGVKRLLLRYAPVTKL